MSIDVTLIFEDGEVLGRVEKPIQELTDLVASIQAEPEASSFPLLRYLDSDGDTVFNVRQMEDFLEEWGRLRAKRKRQRHRRSS
jgi:hypothetical protein